MRGKKNTKAAVEEKVAAEEAPARKRKGRKSLAKGETTAAKKVEEETVVATVATEESPVKKRGGRKPLTEKEKAVAAKKREEDKALAASMKPVLFLQFQGDEVDTAQLVEAAKADFKSKKKRTPITALTLYLKPEERAAYYVINNEYDGKVSY